MRSARPTRCNNSTPEFARAAIAAQFHRHRHIFQSGQCWDELEILKDEPDVFVPHARAFVFADIRKRNPVQNYRARCGLIQSGAQA